MTNSMFASCIQACSNCALVCETCASACLREDDVKMMARCIELDRDCADICRLAATLMSSESEFAKEFCALCAKICRACGEECEKHQVEHCPERSEEHTSKLQSLMRLSYAVF